MWKREQLTTEQAIGQILLLLKERDEWFKELEKRVYELRRRADL
jgi:hypothetical protein